MAGSGRDSINPRQYGEGGGAGMGDLEWQGICQGGHLEKNEPASWPYEGNSSDERRGNVRIVGRQESSECRSTGPFLEVLAEVSARMAGELVDESRVGR